MKNLENQNAILLFVRWPEIGKVKTRLSATMGDDEACRVYRLLAERCFSEALAAKNSQVIVCATGATCEEFASWLPGAADYILQPEGDLGERLGTAFQQTFQAGASSVMAIGTDAPTLDSQSISDAAELLGTHDVVVYPATDGGYVLIGCSSDQPSLFNEMHWSTDRLLAQTLNVCKQQNLCTHVGPQFSDVDTEEDWNAVQSLF